MSTIPTITAPSLDVNLLQSSFLKLEPQADEFASTFYRILFNKYPRIQPLFASTDMAKQKNKLVESLKLVMVNVHNSEALTSILKNLGARHVQYGAVLNDYPLIGDALLQSLEKHLGKDWNAEVKQTWTLAYGMIADTMAAGAKAEMAKEPSPVNVVKPVINSGSDLPVNLSEDSATNDRDRSTNESAGTPLSVKIILLTSFGLAGICGYMLLNLNRSPVEPTQPTSVEQSK
jgi:hemoglobin-like flavoprotein